MRNIIIVTVAALVLGAGYFIFVGNKPSDMRTEMPAVQNPSNEQIPVAKEPPKTSPVTAPKPNTNPVAHTANIQDFAFSPSSLTIKKGDMITWTNKDAAPHTVTWDNGGLASSGTLKTGDSYSFTFNTVGTFSYLCAFHPSMKGKIIVE